MAKINLDKVGACASAICAVHCLLTGLAIQELLEGHAGRIEGHLKRCRRVLAAMLDRED